jgi:hypothetical protein
MDTHKDNSFAIMVVEEETDDLLAAAGLDENSAACVVGMMLSMKLSMGATSSQNWSELGV